MDENKLKERVALLEQSYEALHTSLREACVEIKEIKEKLLARPSWMVMVIISGLMTLSGSLIVFIVTK